MTKNAVMRRGSLYPEFFEGVLEANQLLDQDEAADTTAMSPSGEAAPWLGSPLPHSEESVWVRQPRAFTPATVPPGVPRTEFITGETTVDAIAAYFPWHFHGERWGIRIYQSPLLGFIDATASRARCTADEVAPFVTLQVLHHEWVHFAWEVSATELEDAAHTALYGSYSRYGFNRASEFSSGPLEELIATWAELEFARSTRIRGVRKPRRYVQSVRQINRIGPPGYRDFERMATLCQVRHL
jgi:hypothetical protein